MARPSKSVFISYSRQDEDMARALKDRLGDASITCFMDTSEIRSGEDWRDKTAEALDNSVLVAVICTKNSVASHEVTAEWAYAAGRGLTVVPIIYEPDLGLPAGMEAFDRLDFIDPAHRQWDRLISRIVAIQAENPVTSGVIRSLGIESVFLGRQELVNKFSVPQILSKAAPESELLVVGRSLEGWAREFSEIHHSCETNSLRVRMAIVDPELPDSKWMIPTDYAAVDLTASIEKFKRMPPLSAKSEGSFGLYFLPNSPLLSFTYYTDLAGPCGIFEVSANLPFNDRYSFVLRSGPSESAGFIESVYTVCNDMITSRAPIFSLARDMK